MPNSQPLLSIAVLTYKHEPYVAQTLEGIFMQQVNFDYEVVVSDDCSPDATQAVIETYKAKYPDKLRTVHPPKNLGMWLNFKQLVESCKGKYFAVVEGDDYWIDANKLQQQIDFLEANPDYVCCFHAAQVKKDGDSQNKLAFSRYPQKAVAETTTLNNILFDGNYIPTASIVQRNIYKNNYPACLADTSISPDTMLHLLQAAHGKYFYIDKEMSVYRIHVGGITENRSRLKEFAMMIRMIAYSDENTNGKWHDIHMAASQKWHYWLLEEYRQAGDKKGIQECLNFIKSNKANDVNFHPNFVRKVWLEEFVPGVKWAIKLIGK